MRLLLITFAAALTLTVPAYAVTLPDVEDEVMCVTCGTALNVSQAPSADAERAFIERRIADGLDKDEIKDALVAEYGPKVLAEPRQATAWVIPVALGVFALLLVVAAVRRWRGQAADEPRGEALAEEDRQRLDRDMAAYDL